MTFTQKSLHYFLIIYVLESDEVIERLLVPSDDNIANVLGKMLKMSWKIGSRQ